MAKYTRFINDDQWKLLEPLLPKPKRPKRWTTFNRQSRSSGRYSLGASHRRPLAGSAGSIPSASTCWRRRLWEEQGVWLDVWRKFLSMLDEKGALDWQEAFIDGSFAPAKKGGPLLGLPNGAKERSGWWWSTAKVFLSEAPLPRHRPRKSSSPKKPLKR